MKLTMKACPIITKNTFHLPRSSAKSFDTINKIPAHNTQFVPTEKVTEKKINNNAVSSPVDSIGEM